MRRKARAELDELLMELTVERYRPTQLPPPVVSALAPPMPRLIYEDTPEQIAERQRLLCAALDGHHLAAVVDVERPAA